MDTKNTLKRSPVRKTLPGIIGYLFKEILYQKRWALLPLWVFLALLGIILFFLGSSSILPAIYMLGF